MREGAAGDESAPDAVFFAGHGEQSAGLVTQLRSAGVGATVVGWEGVIDIDFIMVNGIASGRVVDRASELAYFGSYHGYGAARECSWQANGELTTPPVWMWAVS